MTVIELIIFYLHFLYLYLMIYLKKKKKIRNIICLNICTHLLLALLLPQIDTLQNLHLSVCLSQLCSCIQFPVSWQPNALYWCCRCRTGAAYPSHPHTKKKTLQILKLCFTRQPFMESELCAKYSTNYISWLIIVS